MQKEQLRLLLFFVETVSVIEAKHRHGQSEPVVDPAQADDSLPAFQSMEADVRRVFLFLALSTGAILPDQGLANPGLEGTYQGFIWSGGSDAPGTTALTVKPDGAISGTYAFDEMGSEMRGTLTDCAFKAPLLRCTWNDAYGSGALVMRFTGDFWAFEGSWYNGSPDQSGEHPDKGFRWTGAKAGT